MGHDIDRNNTVRHSACVLTRERGLPSRAGTRPDLRRVRQCAGFFEGHANLTEAGGGFCVEPAIAANRAKAPLESYECRHLRVRRHAIADCGKVRDRLDPVDRMSGLRSNRRRPDSDARSGEPGPVKELAGVGLAVRRDIRMTDDAVLWDRMARDQISAQALDGSHLRIRKRAVSPFVTGIDDLDAERDSIETALALPARATRVKSTPRLGH